MNQRLPLFSKAQFRGSLIVLLILVLIFVLPDLLVYFSKDNAVDIDLLQRKEADAYKKVNKRSRYTFRKKESRYLVPPEKFNPNDYTVDQWMVLGLSEKQAKVILKFTKYRLKSNEDLRKVFVINDELFAIIKDSTIYDQPTTYNKPTYEQKFDKSTAKRSLIDVNSANEEELMSVPGIGEYFAKSIIKYRDKLGGYHSVTQLRELYHMDEEKYQKLLPYVEVGSSQVAQLNINTASAEELKKHPYFTWNLANSLVKLRLQKGKYKHVEDCKESVLMTPELFQKLKPYLKVE